MRKRLLVENDIDELDDFRKILLLNKKKLDPNDVSFFNSEGHGFSDIIEVTPHGLLFHFDDLQEFLKFFFPETYQEGSDGEWDAVNYDRMYYGSYDFYYQCQDRAYDDWREGYTLGYFCGSAAEKLRKLVSILDPKLSEDKGIFIDRGGRLGLDDSGGAQVSDLLDTYFKNIGDEIDEIICRGKDRAVSSGAEELMRDIFCDGLKQFGIENWGKSILTNCFKTYFISWGNLVQMYIDKGEFDEPILDLLFQVTEKFRNHPPESYEIEYNVWDNEIFERETCQSLEDLMDEYIEKAHEELSPKYLETVQKLSKLGLFDKVKIPGSKKNLFIRVRSVDPETLKVKYQVGGGSWFSDVKYGESTVDEVIAIATQPGLFDPMDHRINPSERY
jgi:hypothetical protein